MTDLGLIALIAGKTVDPMTGLLADADGSWTNWEPIELGAGSVIAPAHPGISLQIWCYMKSFDGDLAHTYSYDAESNWTTLALHMGPDAPLDDPGASWTCSTDCFVRVTARGLGEGVERTLADAARIKAVEAAPPSISDAMREQLDRVCERVFALREPGDLTLVVLSDVHYSTGCIWPETARNIQEVAARIHPDAIVQLGDVSDGLAPVRVTLSYVERVLGDLGSCGVPVYGCVGNHDANYFKGNSERLSGFDCARLYTGREELWYYEDFPDARVRCFFLQSFDPARDERYGFAREEVRWLRRELRAVPSEWGVLLFSHVPLYASIHYWSDTILNEEAMVGALERFSRRRPGDLLAYIHGHSHVDQVFRKDSFPDISIGCAKFEDFEECKPAGSITPTRVMGEASQDLWNVLVLKRRENRIELVRFGAGEDMSLEAYRKPKRDLWSSLQRMPGKKYLRHVPGKRFVRRILGGRA